MKKRIALLLSVLLALGMIPLSIVFAQSSADAVFTVEADKAEVNVGDEVTFSVYVETKIPFTGIQADINTPKGMTYVANSGKVPDGLKEQLEFTEASFTELTQRITLGNDIAYSATGKLKIMEFKCVAAEGSVNGFDVSIDEIDITDSNFESFGFAVVSANVKVRIPVTGVTLDKATLTLNNSVNNTAKLTVTVDPDNATNRNLIWKSSNESIATVDGDGNVTALKKGTATITAITEDGGFSASCLVTVNCSHLNTTDVSAEGSTCIKHGHKAYTVCNDCGEVTQGSNSELPLGDHIGGTATCVKKAVCDVCHKEYGNLAAHKYGETVKADYLKTAATCGSKAVYYKSCDVCGIQSEETFETGDYDYTNHIGETYLKNQKEATCYNEGYTGDTYCRTCDREISKGQPIAKNAHNPASVWTTDETSHWKECQTVGCGNIIDKAAHSGGEATCVNKAICSVCKVEYGAIDPSNHKHTEVRDAKDATCCEKGYTGDTWCTDCNTKISSGSDIPETGKHTDADGKWETDGKNHWHTCYFGTKFDLTAHSGGEATCIGKANCSVCGVEYGNLDTSNHKHTEVRNAKEATCCEKGYTGDTWCIDCSTKISSGSDIPATGKHTDVDGKWETDGTNHWHTCYFGTKFDVAAHSGGEATCVKKAICSVCNAEYGNTNAFNHKHTELRNVKAATEQEKGYTGDAWCLDCNKKIAGGTEVDKLVIEANGGSPESPKTGDDNNIVVWSLISVLSLAGLVVTIVVSKKKQVR